MNKYYLIKVQNDYFQCGSLVKYDGIFSSISHNSQIRYENCNVTSDWIELSSQKMKYLLLKSVLQRLEIHNSQLFEKLEKLKPNDRCYIIDVKEKKYVVKKHKNIEMMEIKVKCSILESMNEDYEFLVKTENGVQRTISILDIDSIVNLQYYICSSKFQKLPEGTMVLVEDGVTTTYPEKDVISVNIDKLYKIQLDEAKYLSNFPLKERPELFKNKLWERVNQLKIGDRCYNKAPTKSGLLTIIGMQYKNQSLMYTLESHDGKVICVGQENIRLEKLIREKTNDRGSSWSVLSIDQLKFKKNRISFQNAIKELTRKYRKSKMKLFELSVISPHCVDSIETVECEDWIIDSKIDFRLGESCKKYCGTLKWVGLINKTKCAVVHVESIQSNDSISKHICHKEVIERINIPMLDNLVIVLLATVTENMSLENNPLLKSLLEYINDSEMSTPILMKLIENWDDSALRMATKGWRNLIFLEEYPDLLTNLINQNRLDIIGLLLNNFIPTFKDNLTMLTIAKRFLLDGNEQSFQVAIKKCTNVNLSLSNGETFLTSILKECDDEDVINKVIVMSIFNVNMTNDTGESLLVLACKKLMVSTVKLLLSNTTLVSCNDNIAIRTVTNIMNDKSYGERGKEAMEILGLLTDDLKMDSNECKICMDRRINTVFQCGHSSCYECSQNIFKCWKCREDIIDRKRIYLD